MQRQNTLHTACRSYGPFLEQLRVPRSEHVYLIDFNARIVAVRSVSIWKGCTFPTGDRGLRAIVSTSPLFEPRD